MQDLTLELATLIARRFAVLGDPTRVRLLSALHARGEASVGELASAIAGSHANTSKHLNVLLGERLVGRRREGPRALYRIIDPALMRICDEVCEAVRLQLAELTALVEPPSVEPPSAAPEEATP